MQAIGSVGRPFSPAATASPEHYMFIVNSLELYSQDIIVEDIRFGMKRAQAIFGMHTTLGGFSTMMAGLLLWVRLNCPLYIKSIILYLVC